MTERLSRHKSRPWVLGYHVRSREVIKLQTVVFDFLGSSSHVRDHRLTKILVWSTHFGQRQVELLRCVKTVSLKDDRHCWTSTQCLCYFKWTLAGGRHGLSCTVRCPLLLHLSAPWRGKRATSICSYWLSIVWRTYASPSYTSWRISKRCNSSGVLRMPISSLEHELKASKRSVNPIEMVVLIRITQIMVGRHWAR